MEELLWSLKRLHLTAQQHNTLLSVKIEQFCTWCLVTHFASALSLSSCSSPTSRPMEVSNPAYLSEAPYSSWSKVVPVMGTPFCSPLPFSAMLAKDRWAKVVAFLRGRPALVRQLKPCRPFQLVLHYRNRANLASPARHNFCELSCTCRGEGLATLRTRAGEDRNALPHWR